VLVLEDVLEQELRALLGRERLEQDEKGQRNRLRALHLKVRPARIAGEHRLRQPRADVGLARRTRRLEAIQAEARHDRHRKRLRRADIGLVRAAIAQPRVLQHVLGIRRASEHAVRDREQARPFRREDVRIHDVRP
jgi:hypothetical protein